MQIGCRQILIGIILATAIILDAQDCPAAGSVQGAAAEAHTYSIPPGPLDVVLIQFATASKMDLAFDADALRKLRSAGLTGPHTIADGIRILLHETGYYAVDLRDGGYLIRKTSAADTQVEAAQTLPTVTVVGQAYRADVSQGTEAGHGIAGTVNLGALGSIGGMDSPISTRVFDAREIRDQQAYSVADVVENDASVRSVSKPGGILDAFTIRGFPYSNGNFGEIAFDGVYGIASNYRVATGYVERVELIKGPATLLYGMSPGGSVGGAINIVPKRAGDADVTEAAADYGSLSQFGANIDVGRRLGGDRAFGIRFNGGYRGGDTALDNQHRDAGSGALAFDYRGSQLRASLDVIAQYERISAPFRLLHIVAGIDVPAAPDGHCNISQPWESSEIHDGATLARVAYDVDENTQVFAHVGGSRTRVARVFAITPTIINEAGDVSVSDTNYRFDVARTSAEAGMRWRVAIGPMTHRIALSASGYRDRLNRGLVNSAIMSLTNLYDPVPLPPQSIADPASVPKVSSTYLTGLSLVDTVSTRDESLQLTAGFRYQRIRSDNFNPEGVVIEHYDAGALAPLLGIVFKPNRAVSLYAHRIDGLSKGDVAPTSAANAGEVMAPYRSTQYEAGVRLARQDLEATFSAFQIRRPVGVMSGASFAADGEQRNRGLELGVQHELLPGVRVNAGAMWLDATISGSPALSGKTPVGVPSWQLNLGAEWDVRQIPGLTLVTAVSSNGAQYVDAANTQLVPSWTRWDLGMRYRVSGARYPATVRLAIRNVLGRRGWAAVDAYGGLAQADPRVALVSVTASF